MGFFTSLHSDAQQIRTTIFGAGTPILLDGTSNTILVTENDAFDGGTTADAMSAGGGAPRCTAATARTNCTASAAATGCMAMPATTR